MLATQNRYLKPVVPIVIGLIAVLVLLAIGSAISGLRSDGSATLDWGAISKWGAGLLAGVIIAYLLFIEFVEAPIWHVDTRVVVYSAIGAALYGVFAWVTNIAALPSVSNVSIRPAIVFPLFFGYVFGPVVGFFTGFVGNILGDALTGWGVYPVWDIGNGLVGLIPGLVLAFKDKKQSLDVLTWVGVIVSLLAVVLVFINPQKTFDDPLAGTKNVDYSSIWWIAILAAVVFIGARYLLARNVDLAAAVVWATLGVIIGIGFASMLDIYINGYSFFVAFVGEFVPAAGSDILLGSILVPILLAAWNAARAQTGR